MNCQKRRPRKRTQQSVDRNATNNTTNQIAYTKGNVKPNTKRSQLKGNLWIYPRYRDNVERNAKKSAVRLTTICYAVFRKKYFPIQWKVAQIIVIPKPGKPLEESKTYTDQHTNLRKHMLKGLCPILEESRILLDHQFGFQQKHSTIETVGRFAEIIRGIKKNYYSEA